MRLTILALTLASVFGCSERYRDADTGYSAEEIEGFLRDIGGRASLQGTGASSIKTMINDPSTSTYFAGSFKATGDHKPSMGPIEAVTPVEFPELGIKLGLNDIQDIHVFFLDQIGTDGRYNHGFIFDIQSASGGAFTAYTWANDSTSGLAPSSVDDEGIFEVSFSLEDGKTLILRSDDTTEGELNDVVQFELLIDDGTSEPYFIGQVSSMVGFLAD